MFNTLLNSKGSKRKCLWISMRKDQNIFILFDFQFTSEHILISYIIYPPQTFIRFDSAVGRQPSAVSHEHDRKQSCCLVCSLKPTFPSHQCPHLPSGTNLDQTHCLKSYQQYKVIHKQCFSSQQYYSSHFAFDFLHTKLFDSVEGFSISYQSIYLPSIDQQEVKECKKYCNTLSFLRQRMDDVDNNKSRHSPESNHRPTIVLPTSLVEEEEKVYIYSRYFSITIAPYVWRHPWSMPVVSFA